MRTQTNDPVEMWLYVLLFAGGLVLIVYGFCGDMADHFSSTKKR